MVQARPDAIVPHEPGSLVTTAGVDGARTSNTIVPAATRSG